MSDELKPCPFCGKSPASEWHSCKGATLELGCANPDCPMMNVDTGLLKPEAAKKAWNTRIGEEALRIKLGKEIAKAEYSERIHAAQIERVNEEMNNYAEVLAKTKERAERLQKENEQLRSALLVILDQVDYTAGNCGLTEMVGAVLDRSVIAKARGVLRGGEG
jgi:hypothetical protein